MIHFSGLIFWNVFSVNYARLSAQLQFVHSHTGGRFEFGKVLDISFWLEGVIPPSFGEFKS